MTEIPRSPWRLAVGLVAGANAVAALAGAVGLGTGLLSLGGLTGRLPLGSTVLGGLALGVLVALPQALLAVLAAVRSHATAAVSVLVGAGLVGWIVVEVAVLHVLAGLQVAYLLVGLLQIGSGFALGRHDPGLGPRSLAAMVWAVVADLPRFLTAPCYRRRHLRWGATDAEVGGSMPGDHALSRATYRATRAITIDAPPERVWPWLVQVGSDRAGWYSDDLLDHGGLPSSFAVVDRWQDPQVGDVVAMSRRAVLPEGSFFVVDDVEPAQWLLWWKPDSTWSWRLTPAGTGTRVVTRLRAAYPWRHPLRTILAAALMEFGDFAMMRRMLLGLRKRAESGPLPEPSGSST